MRIWGQTVPRSDTLAIISKAGKIRILPGSRSILNLTWSRQWMWSLVNNIQDIKYILSTASIVNISLIVNNYKNYGHRPEESPRLRWHCNRHARATRRTTDITHTYSLNMFTQTPECMRLYIWFRCIFSIHAKGL